MNESVLVYSLNLAILRVHFVRTRGDAPSSHVLALRSDSDETLMCVDSSTDAAGWYLLLLARPNRQDGGSSRAGSAQLVSDLTLLFGHIFGNIFDVCIHTYACT